MKIEFKITKRKNLASLQIDGDLIAQNGSDFKGQLQTLYTKHEDIELSLKKVNTIDVSALQLIKSFKLSTESSRKKFQIVLPESKDLISLLTNTAMIQILK